MRLQIQNFCSIVSAEYELGETGLVLIQGPSGCGKTTLIDSIFFCLFGTGAKLASHLKLSSAETTKKPEKRPDGGKLGRTEEKLEVGRTEVSLEFPKTARSSILKVTRARKPNTLRVETQRSPDSTPIVLQDEAAQSFLFSRFGKAFESVSYLVQGAQTAFILMSPQEKSAFIEQYAFSANWSTDRSTTGVGSDPSQLKKRVKILLEDRNRELIEATTQLQTLKQILSRTERRGRPIRPSSSLSEDLLQKRLTRLSTGKSQLQSQLQTWKLELADLDLFRSRLESGRLELERCRKTRSDLQAEISELQPDPEYLAVLKSQLSLRDLEANLERTLEKLVSVQTEHQTNLELTLRNLRARLWPEESEAETTQMLRDLQESRQDLDRVARLTRELSENRVEETEIMALQRKIPELRETISGLKLSANLLTCPGCHLSIRFVSGKLERAEAKRIEASKDRAILEQELTQTEARLRQLEIRKNAGEKLTQDLVQIRTLYPDGLPDLNEVLGLLATTERYQKENRDRALEIQSLERSEASRHLQTRQLEQERDELKARISEQEKIVLEQVRIFSDHLVISEGLSKYVSLVGPVGPSDLLEREGIPVRDYVTRSIRSISSSELRDVIETVGTREMIRTMREKSLRELELEIRTRRTQAQTLRTTHRTRFGRIRSRSALASQILLLSSRLEQIEVRITQTQAEIQDVQRYQRELVEFRKVQDLERQTLAAEKRETEARTYLSRATQLKEKILEAEGISLQSFLESIASHTQVYLDLFFPDDPPHLTLSTFKETKTSTKPQINLLIEYKGREFTSVHSLSGGEINRVVLASTLALGEIFQTQLFLLDECTANLDAETTTLIVSGLRDLFPDKLILMVAHQAIAGLYDRVIEIGNH